MKTILVSPKAVATVERLRSFRVTPEIAARVAAFEARQNAPTVDLHVQQPNQRAEVTHENDSRCSN